MIVEKVCPLVLRRKHAGYEILAFEHPQARFQLVKGTIEIGESIHEVCRRELKEESGLVGVVGEDLGSWQYSQESPVWALCLMKVEGDIPEHWQYATNDGGGLLFDFFWQGVNTVLSKKFHPIYIAVIHSALKMMSTRKPQTP